MTDVLGALNRGTGKILGSFREIPAESFAAAKKVIEKLKKLGFRGCTLFGQPGEPLLGLPVAAGKVGLVVLGGLNPSAGLEEAGLVSDSCALAVLQDYEALSPLEMIVELNEPARSPAPPVYSPFREPLGHLSTPPG